MLEDKEEERQPEHPWIQLASTYDVEAWIASFDRDLQAAVKKPNSSTHGICFCLEAGGEVYMQTNGEGDIVLDVQPEAEWVTPLISAATGVDDPGRQFWAVPGDKLVQLIYGLNSLIASTRIVLDHRFRARKW